MMSNVVHFEAFSLLPKSLPPKVGDIRPGESRVVSFGLSKVDFSQLTPVTENSFHNVKMLCDRKLLTKEFGDLSSRLYNDKVKSQDVLTSLVERQSVLQSEADRAAAEVQQLKADVAAAEQLKVDLEKLCLKVQMKFKLC